MASVDVKPGVIWKIDKSSMPGIAFLTVDATNEPVGGDLCDDQGTALRAPQFKATTVGSASAALRTIGWICLEGKAEVDAINNDSWVAKTGKKPAVLQIGSNRARNADLTGKRKPFLPVVSGLLWVMTVKGGTTVTVGSTYGITRVGSGDYQINGADSQAVVKVVGIYEPDWMTNGSSADRYWVTASLPGGYM